MGAEAILFNVVVNIKVLCSTQQYLQRKATLHTHYLQHSRMFLSLLCHYMQKNKTKLGVQGEDMCAEEEEIEVK